MQSGLVAWNEGIRLVSETSHFIVINLSAKNRSEYQIMQYKSASDWRRWRRTHSDKMKQVRNPFEIGMMIGESGAFSQIPSANCRDVTMKKNLSTLECTGSNNGGYCSKCDSLLERFLKKLNR